MRGDRWEGRRRLAVLSAVVSAVCAGLVGPAAGAAPADRDAARAKLAEGVRLLESDNPVQALARFEEAYGLVPSPRIQYNMALAYRRLDRLAEAYTAFEGFLRDASDENAQHVSHARQELERLSKRVGFIEVTSDVLGAEVMLDGRGVGVIPLAGPLPVDTGHHELVVRSPGLESRSRRFNAVAGETVSLRIDLRPVAQTALGAAPVAPAPPEGNRLPVRTTAFDRASEPRPSFVERERDSRPEDPRPSWTRFAGYGLLAAGAAGVGGGVYLLLRNDGCGDRLPGFMCNTTSESKVPGWILVGAGAGMALGGAILLYASREVQVAMTVGPGAISLKGSL